MWAYLNFKGPITGCFEHGLPVTGALRLEGAVLRMGDKTVAVFDGSNWAATAVVTGGQRLVFQAVEVAYFSRLHFQNEATGGIVMQAPVSEDALRLEGAVCSLGRKSLAVFDGSSWIATSEVAGGPFSFQVLEVGN